MDSVSKKRAQQNNLTSTVDVFNATRYNEQNDTDKEDYVMDRVENKTLESIGAFSVEWAVFEQVLFGKECKMAAIVKDISHEPIENDELLKTSWQFFDALLRFAGERDKVLPSLKFRTSEAEREANAAVAKWIYGDNVTYLALIAAIFRIRCNMFHGEKMVWMLDRQQEIFDTASEVLDKCIEMRDQLPMVCEQADLNR